MLGFGVINTPAIQGMTNSFNTNSGIVSFPSCEINLMLTLNLFNRFFINNNMIKSYVPKHV